MGGELELAEELGADLVVTGEVPAMARASTARFVQRFGVPVAGPEGSLTHMFPTTGDLAAIGPGDLDVPPSHQRPLSRLVGSLADGTLALDVGTDRQQARSEYLWATLENTPQPSVGEVG